MKLVGVGCEQVVINGGLGVVGVWAVGYRAHGWEKVGEMLIVSG